MRAIKKFGEFIKDKIVKRQSIDKSRAEFLVKESHNSYNNLLEKIQKIELSDNNANDFVKSCYDIIMEIIRAKMLLEGYNASGFGAHEADVQFADQIRFFRNGMLYYGTILDKEYAEKVIDFTKRIYHKLRQTIKK